MSVHHQDPWLTVHVGDCRAVLATMEPESVHTVVTSPPYWGLRDYGHGDQLGLEPTPEQYVENMVAVFREVRRVLRSDGTLWLNLGDSYAGGGTIGRNDDESMPRPKGGHRVGSASPGAQGTRPPVVGLKPKDLVGIPWRVAFALQADGWYLRSDIIWAKPNPMPESVTDRPTKAHEYLFLLTKSPRYWYDADAVREDLAGPLHAPGNKVAEGVVQRNDFGTERMDKVWGNPAGRNRRSVWTVATQPYPGAHFATFPPKLVEPCILAGTSERGVCPECGAPWRRMTRVAGRVQAHWEGTEQVHAKAAKGKHGATSVIETGSYAVRETTGWKPTCDHPGDPIPATVLDPFGGSGTTAMVAQHHSRRAVLIDLNPDYIDQQLKRNQAMPLGLEAA